MVTTQRPRIAIVASTDARNPRSWSGIPYCMAGAIARHVGDPVFIGGLSGRVVKARRALDRLSRSVIGGGLLPAQSTALGARWAREVEARLREESPDLILAPVGSALIANLKTDIPIIYSSDATARLILGYYPDYTGLRPAVRDEFDRLEEAAIARSDLVVYPTEWAARSALGDYGANPSKVHVLPYGANFPDVPARELAVADRAGPVCRLLFVGVNWARKGGAIAVDALRRLRGMGIDAELTIVGCEPPRGVEADRMAVIPFLDKNDPQQRARLSELYLRSDFLVLPTRAECYGIVFCEASAHGVPSIATATGGVPSIVRSGVNGFTIPEEEGGDAYAETIAAVFADEERHRRLRETSRAEFQRRLNWDGWGRSVARLAEPLLKGARPGPAVLPGAVRSPAAPRRRDP